MKGKDPLEMNYTWEVDEMRIITIILIALHTKESISELVNRHVCVWACYACRLIRIFGENCERACSIHSFSLLYFRSLSSSSMYQYSLRFTNSRSTTY